MNEDFICSLVPQQRAASDAQPAVGAWVPSALRAPEHLSFGVGHNTKPKRLYIAVSYVLAYILVYLPRW